MKVAYGDICGYPALAESGRFKIVNLYESAYILDKKNKHAIYADDFYGDPSGAVISSDEKIAVIFGCGLMICFLKEPYLDYSCNGNPSHWFQWFETGMSEDNKYVDNVNITDEGHIQVYYENKSISVITVRHGAFESFTDDDDGVDRNYTRFKIALRELAEEKKRNK